MDLENLDISMFDLVLALSATVGLASTRVMEHQNRVAYFSGLIAKEMGYSNEEQLQVVAAAYLHDVGATLLHEPLDLMHFVTEKTYLHAELGYYLLRTCKTIAGITNIIRHHHAPWDRTHKMLESRQISPLSYVIQVADRIELLINPEVYILFQVEQIKQAIHAQRGKLLQPEAVDAFMKLVDGEAFWLNAMTQSAKETLKSYGQGVEAPKISLESVLCFSELVAKVTDFQNDFTATHTPCVSIVAEELAELMGLSRDEILKIRIAANLYNIGRLSSSKEVLNRHGPLSEAEHLELKEQLYNLYTILHNIEPLEKIVGKIVLHPRDTHDNISISNEILLAANSFISLMEDRPHRKAKTKEETFSELDTMVENNLFNEKVIDVLRKHYDKIKKLSDSRRQEVAQEYQKIQEYIKNFDAARFY